MSSCGKNPEQQIAIETTDKQKPLIFTQKIAYFQHFSFDKMVQSFNLADGTLKIFDLTDR